RPMNNTLMSSPLSSVLDGLFAEAEASIAGIRQEMATLSPEERAAMMASKTEYRVFYERAKDFPLDVSRETGTLLYLLARSTGARNIGECGPSFGVSTLHLAAALRDNDGGRLVTSEFESSKVARARASFSAAGVADLVDLREGDALETLAKGLPPS